MMRRFLAATARSSLLLACGCAGAQQGTQIGVEDSIEPCELTSSEPADPALAAEELAEHAGTFEGVRRDGNEQPLDEVVTLTITGAPDDAVLERYEPAPTDEPRPEPDCPDRYVLPATIVLDSETVRFEGVVDLTLFEIGLAQLWWVGEEGDFETIPPASIDEDEAVIQASRYPDEPWWLDVGYGLEIDPDEPAATESEHETVLRASLE